MCPPVAPNNNELGWRMPAAPFRFGELHRSDDVPPFLFCGGKNSAACRSCGTRPCRPKTGPPLWCSCSVCAARPSSASFLVEVCRILYSVAYSRRRIAYRDSATLTAARSRSTLYLPPRPATKPAASRAECGKSTTSGLKAPPSLRPVHPRSRLIHRSARTL